MSVAYSQRLIGALRQHFKPAKIQRIEKVLASRAGNRRIILENISDPHNAAACLRSADAFGIQHVHLTESYDNFSLQKPGLGGSAAANASERKKHLQKGYSPNSNYLTISKFF